MLSLSQIFWPQTASTPAKESYPTHSARDAEGKVWASYQGPEPPQVPDMVIDNWKKNYVRPYQQKWGLEVVPYGPLGPKTCGSTKDMYDACPNAECKKVTRDVINRCLWLDLPFQYPPLTEEGKARIQMMQEDVATAFEKGVARAKTNYALLVGGVVLMGAAILYLNMKAKGR